MPDKFLASPSIGRVGAATLLTSQPCGLKRFRSAAAILGQADAGITRNFKAEMDSFIKHEIRQASSDPDFCGYLEKERLARDARHRNNEMKSKRIARIQEEDALKQMIHRNNLPYADGDEKVQAKAYACQIPHDEASMKKFQKERLHPVPIDSYALDRRMHEFEKVEVRSGPMVRQTSLA
eukprot:TRINITY_DN94628_c0_g1_i1.p1 TRINITY_DN94628_c0_g1~~TRINITY_DN94628_c0_g1_i1.p1  ORF type:complete len:180 (+),score=32.37 TRINITY_DN94628_c0_g1_i1:46-585(+)